MPILTSFARGLSGTFGRSRRDQHINDEVSFHIASRADDLVARGVSRNDAVRQAQLEFGGGDKYKEQIRDARGFPMLEDLARDLAYAARSLRRSPGLVVISVLSLALGVGANATLSSALSAVFLSVPTATEPERLVWVEPGNTNQFSYLNYRDLRESQIFAAVLGYRPVRLSLRANAAAESISGMAVTSNFFEALGVSAQIGRTFMQKEAEAEGMPRLVVLSHGFWMRRFRGDSAVMSRTLTLNGEPFVVLGVLPEPYQAIIPLFDPDVYVPLSSLVLPNIDSRRNSNALNVLGRLRVGTTRQQMQVAVTTLGQQLERTYPEPNLGMGRPAQLNAFGRLALEGAPLAVKIFPPILVTLCGLILLIACANVAGLLLTRATSREREIALRVALGATRARLVRALLAESFLLAILGAAAGVLLTLWLMPVLRDITLPTVGVVHLAMRADLKLLSSALGLVLITGLVCGLLPALKATRGNLVAPLHLGGQGSTPPLRLRHLLVVVEVAASVVLLVTSLLFVRTLARLTTVTMGIDADHGVVATIELIPGRYTKDSLLTAVGRVLDRLDATPGIRSSSIADILPLAADSSSSRFEGEPALPESPRTLVNSVGPRYFETMGISLLHGRGFQASDRAGAPQAVIVSQAFARSYFPDEEPLGKRVRSGKDDPFAEIVGVVQDANYEFVGEAPKPVLYYAYAQRSVSSQNRPLRIHARTSASPAALLRTVSDIVAELDKDAPVRVTTLRDAMGFEVGLRRATSLLLGWLGALGLFLATVGLYGVVSLVVASRMSEIGVRIALGASRNSVLWDILKRGLTLTVWGLVAGSAVALVAARVLVSLLVGVSPADPIAFTVSAIVFVLVGLLASYLPARRATRVNPLVALRDQ